MILLCWIFLVFDFIFQIIFFIHSGVTAIISTFIVSVHFIFCVFYTGWKTDKRKDWAELSYKEFKNLYMVMPNGFCLESSWISYNSQGIEFKSYLDYLRYKRFFKRRKKWEVKIKQMETQAELIKELKEGLKEAERENDEWVKGKIGKD